VSGSRGGGLTLSPQLRDEVVGGLVEERRHVVVQGVHVLHQPVVGLVVHLVGHKTDAHAHGHTHTHTCAHTDTHTHTHTHTHTRTHVMVYYRAGCTGGTSSLLFTI